MQKNDSVVMSQTARASRLGRAVICAGRRYLSGASITRGVCSPDGRLDRAATLSTAPVTWRVEQDKAQTQSLGRGERA